jgi:hypothetical protein
MTEALKGDENIAKTFKVIFKSLIFIKVRAKVLHRDTEVYEDSVNCLVNASSLFLDTKTESKDQLRG